MFDRILNGPLHTLLSLVYIPHFGESSGTKVNVYPDSSFITVVSQKHDVLVACVKPYVRVKHGAFALAVATARYQCFVNKIATVMMKVNGMFYQPQRLGRKFADVYQ